MAMKPDDQEIGALYREGGDDAPSAQLDAAILQAARAAVARPAATAGWRRWRLGLPVFASLLLVVMLGLLLRPQAPDAPGIGPVALNETAPPAATARGLESPAQEPAPAATNPPASAPLPAASQTRTAEAAIPQAAAKISAPMAEQEEARSPIPAARAPAESRMTATADAAAPLPEKTENVEKAATAAPAAALAAPARQSAPAQAVRPAGEWLAEIQKMLDQERIDEAKASLSAFRKAYPDTPLPPAIRQRLLP